MVVTFPNAFCINDLPKTLLWEKTNKQTPNIRNKLNTVPQLRLGLQMSLKKWKYFLQNEKAKTS